ncbi:MULTISPECIES: iron-containing alcohol dehydrogenase [Caldilinea]|jgi:alcohol dehydrogenase class IV|uniref:Putative dehydrogenase n=1 Tax=Caldilinea aerophila (strain DSM 14535 / JCM 11387 / NBRC 104270 / STL-6-O1) TaxID=926550 RepID=I0I641_CALAS|nr:MULTISPECIES: iron-containing alcohol dehydrogenase [Caldilinea]MBO9392533.1 iron-containing alcohol dehydrogenase [Caldilinea sp.]BAM00729.1 putative dehydrogenase [Caldilinea aerophila DSM 14535 = NBRC 104270]GIV72071.1 MAG: alcohol dehydrogenase [Caldilinea sp.]
MSTFEFATAQRILFGAGRLQESGALAAALGERALVVTGAHPQRAQPLLDLLDAAKVKGIVFSVAGEPTVADAVAGVEAALRNDVQLVIGFGGGSAIDAAKAIAALAANPGDVFDYLEVIGKAQPLTNPSLPVIAIPTTAGTGSEVTRNAVLASPQHGVKVSVRSATMLPRVALIDPELTYSVPPSVTAATGMDALTQLIEPFVSSRANPLTDAICREGLRYAARSLPIVVREGQNVAARCDMAFASLCGGLALANAGLGAVHGFAGPFGGMYHAPHGAICAALLPEVCAANVRALRQRQPNHPALLRYAELATLLTGSPDATIEDAIAWLRSLVNAFEIPPLSQYGFAPADAPLVVARARVASSMKANPIALTDEELTAILLAAA